MKTFRIACVAVVLVAGMVATASAGDRGAAIGKSTLSSMGLGGMQQMSDSEGLAVRGKGTFAYTSGSGTANFFGGTTESTKYNSGSSHLFAPSSSNGSNYAFVGSTLGLGGSTSFLIIGAVGGSTASAH